MIAPSSVKRRGKTSGNTNGTTIFCELELGYSIFGNII